jgi:hypothetical protein
MLTTIPPRKIMAAGLARTLLINRYGSAVTRTVPFDTGRVHGPFRVPDDTGDRDCYGSHYPRLGWDAAPDTRDVRPDGPAFA